MTPVAASPAFALALVALVLVRQPTWGDRLLLIVAVGVLTPAVARAEQRRRSLRADLERLRHAAAHDALTGLANRTAFMTALHAHLAAGRRCAVVLADLDGFKAVNDTYGHLVGDDLLVEVGRRLAALARPGDLPARLAGDEFALLRPDTDDADAAALAGAAALALDRPVTVDGRVVALRASVGAAVRAADLVNEPGRELVRRADMAMYEAKRSTTTQRRVPSSGECRHRRASATGAAAARSNRNAVLGTRRGARSS